MKDVVEEMLKEYRAKLREKRNAELAARVRAAHTVEELIKKLRAQDGLNVAEREGERERELVY